MISLREMIQDLAYQSKILRFVYRFTNSAEQLKMINSERCGNGLLQGTTAAFDWKDSK